MAVPLQYQSQFIPTNFGQINNVLGMYRQDMNRREQQFDQAAQMENQALANIYGMETLDPDLLTSAADDLSKRIESVVEKRGGDYGAASKDIAKLISKEARNPIYGLNRRKLEQTKLLEEALARNPNLMVLQDPRSTSLQDIKSPDQIGYQVLDPEEVRKRALQDLSFLDRRKLAGISTTPTGYDVATYTRGPSDKEISELMNDPQMVNQLKSYFPQLQGMNSQEMDQFLGNTIGTAARTYQRSPEERVLGFNPSLREKLKLMGESNPYAAVVPTSGVGMEGIKNVHPIEKPKDFWKMPDDNSVLGILHKDITQDIISSKDFLKNNKEMLKEFGSIQEAKKIVDNYQAAGSVVNTPIIKQRIEEEKEKGVLPGHRLYQQRAGQIYNELESQGKIDPNAARRTKEEFERASQLINNFESKLSDRLHTENSDMMKQFKHYNIFAGPDKLQRSTEQKMKRFQDFTSNQLELTNLKFETSSNEDIDFTDQLALIDDGDEDYKKAQEGNYKITGVAVDPILGVKLKVETENAEGGTTTHIAAPSSPDIEQLIIMAYTGGNKDTEAFSTYERFFNNRLGNNILQNITEYPELAPEEGLTVGEYKKELQKKANAGLIDEQKARAVIHYLIDSDTNNNVIL